MRDSEPSGGPDENALEITDLRPRPHPDPGRRSGAQRLSPTMRVRHWLTLTLSIVSAILLITILSDHLVGAGSIFQRPTNETSAATPTPTVTPAIPTPTSPPPTAPPGADGAPPLAAAPATCAGAPPPLTPAFPPHQRQSIGQPPVLLGGFIGPYATLPLGLAASAIAYGWSAPYTPYGWPAPIGLILPSNTVVGPITLSGQDPRTGHPLWFGFVVAGEWGAPKQVAPNFKFDLIHPSVPVGGSSDTGAFWYGYIFLPGAGCFTLAVTWPGGGWRFTVSAGTVSGVQ